MASGFMAGASLIVASFTTNVTLLTIILAIGFGPGISFANILSRAMIGRYFKANYATASGIGHAGSPLGMILMAPLVQLFLDTYGWRGALLLLGAINLHLVVCGALLRQPSSVETQVNYKQVPSCGEGMTNSRTNLFKDTLDTLNNRFGFFVCFRLSFWLTTVINICNTVLCIFWFTYFVDHAIAKGFTAHDAVAFTIVGGISNLIFKIVQGPILDRGIVTCRTSLVICSIVSSLCLIIDPWMNSYWLMMANVFVYFIAKGIMSALIDVYTKELLGPELLAYAFSWMELVTGVVIFCVGFVPGLMYDLLDSYDVAFVMMGCILALPLVALFMEWLLVPNRP